MRLVAVWTCALLMCSAGCDTEAGSKCAQLGSDDCTSSPGCVVISATAIGDSGCSSTTAPVGCMQNDKACGEGYTYARDPSGKEWMFGTTCIPQGWISADPSDDIRSRCSAGR
ncbi:MAG: hypothetical protein RL701_2653 [Pseudomonadota bacterium]|jgi:hypothetical protein